MMQEKNKATENNAVQLMESSVVSENSQDKKVEETSKFDVFFLA